MPEVYAVAKALLLAKDSDEAAAAAWKDRMLALRDGCRMAIEALHAEGRLASGWTPQSATDALWTLLLVPGWENLTIDCGWSVEQYIRSTRLLAERAFVAGAGGANRAG